MASDAYEPVVPAVFDRALTAVRGATIRPELQLGEMEGADAYLFAMLRWAKGFGLPLSPRMLDYFDRVAKRGAVRQALAEEGLA